MAASLSAESIASTFAPILRRSSMVSVDGAVYPNPDTKSEVLGARDKESALSAEYWLGSSSE